MKRRSPISAPSAAASAPPRASCQAIAGASGAPRPSSEHAGLGHAGHADRGPRPRARRRAPGGRRLERGVEQRAGVDLGAGGHVPPGRRRAAVGALGAVGVDDRRLACDVVPTSMPSSRSVTAALLAGGRQAIASHPPPSRSARPGRRMRHDDGVAAAHAAAARRSPRPAARPRALGDDEDREAALERGVGAAQPLGAEVGVGGGGSSRCRPCGRAGPRAVGVAGGRAPRARRPSRARASPRPRLDAEAVPLEQDREVGRLLQLDHQDPVADRVRRARRDEDRVAGLTGSGCSAPSIASVSCVARPSARASRASRSSRKPTRDLGARLGLERSSHASVLPYGERRGAPGERAARVDVDGQALAGVEQLDEQRRVGAAAGDVRPGRGSASGSAATASRRSVPSGSAAEAGSSLAERSVLVDADPVLGHVLVRRARAAQRGDRSPPR